MNANKTWMWWTMAGLALALGGCTMDVEDEELPDEEPIADTASAIGDPTFIPCSSVHPSSPGGNMVITRDTSDNVIETQPSVCAVMGLVHVDPGTNNAYEVVADAAMVAFGGGSTSPMTCGLCMQMQQGGGGSGGPPNNTTGFFGRLTTPTTVESIGVMGDYPHGYAPTYGTDWHWSSVPASGGDQSSYCDSYAYYSSSKYGPLTNPYGYELVPYWGGVTWGTYAYQQYDGFYGWIRAASIPTATSGWSAYLQAVPRTDYCN